MKPTDRQPEKSRVVWIDLRNFPEVKILPVNAAPPAEPRPRHLDLKSAGTPAASRATV